MLSYMLSSSIRSIYSGLLINRKVFMCRLWDPDAPEVRQYNPLQEDRKRINQMRIGIIRALREKLGSDFIGGVFNDSYARKICPELILRKKMTSKKHYLSIMKKCGVCCCRKSDRYGTLTVFS